MSSLPTTAVLGAIARPAAWITSASDESSRPVEIETAGSPSSCDQRRVPARLDFPVEVDEGEQPSRRRLGAAVAAGAEAEVLLEPERPRARPRVLDALPAAVGGARVDDDALDVLGRRVTRERLERARQAGGAVVVDEDDRELHARGYTDRAASDRGNVSRFPRCPQAHSAGRGARCSSPAPAGSSAATSPSCSSEPARRCGRSSATPRAATTAGSSRLDRDGCATRSRSSAATSRTRRPSAGAVAGREVVFHLGALIPIPYSYRAPARVRRRQRRRDAERARGRAPRGVARIVHTSTSEVYGTAQTRPDRRGAPAAPAVAVRGDEGRRRPARALVPALVRDAGRRRAAVQHVRPASERPRRDPDDRHAGAAARRSSSSARPSRRATSSTSRTRCRDHALRRGRRRRGRGDQPRHRRRRSRSASSPSASSRSLGKELPVALDEDRLRPPDSEVERLVRRHSRRRSACSAGSRRSTSTRACDGRSTGSPARSTPTSRRSTTSEQAVRSRPRPARR